jgi:predicted anti-sigma-YlaC factor YlaD
MSELNCEMVCLAAMVILDGREAELSAEAIEKHLTNCPACRDEVEQMTALETLLESQKRREQAADVWPTIREVVVSSPRKETSRAWVPFVVLGVLLLGYRLIELIPKANLGMIFKVVPILIVIAVFMYVKENPFKINAQLRLEGE